MSLLEWIRIRRRRSTPVHHRANVPFPQEQSTSDVPREYRGLYTYLEHRYASVVVLTFEQIEALLGFALPAAARTDREWWADIADPQRQWAAWTEAGRTAAPNLAARVITFERAV